MNSDNFEAHPDDWKDLTRRAKSHKNWFRRNQPKRVADLVAQTVQKRGLAQSRVAGQWKEAWNEAVGRNLAPHTRVGALKRGVLEITVANSLLLQELGFEKQRLLTTMQRAPSGEAIKQLRFRVGSVGQAK